MAHNGLILGRSQYGKSSLAKGLAREFKRAGRRVMVLDPLLDSGWEADFITDDRQAFLEVFWGSFDCVCFVEEAAESSGKGSAMVFTATRGRHQVGAECLGHSG